MDSNSNVFVEFSSDAASIDHLEGGLLRHKGLTRCISRWFYLRCLPLDELFLYCKGAASKIITFYIAAPLTSISSSLLSFALLKIKTGGLMNQSWRWLFLIEGLATFLVGIIAFFKMPASPAETKTWFRKKGWYSDRQEKFR